MRHSRKFAQRPDHRVQRVGDADDEGVGGVVADAFTHGLHDLEVDAQQVVARHARLARHASGDDADVCTRDIGIIVGAAQLDVELLDRAGLGEIEGLALRRAFADVEEDDVPQFLEGDQMGERAADLSGTDESDLGSGHVCLRYVRMNPAEA